MTREEVAAVAYEYALQLLSRRSLSYVSDKANVSRVTLYKLIDDKTELSAITPMFLSHFVLMVETKPELKKAIKSNYRVSPYFDNAVEVLNE